MSAFGGKADIAIIPQMLAAGVSRYHPDPLRALAAVPLFATGFGALELLCWRRKHSARCAAALTHGGSNEGRAHFSNYVVACWPVGLLSGRISRGLMEIDGHQRCQSKCCVLQRGRPQSGHFAMQGKSQRPQAKKAKFVRGTQSHLKTFDHAGDQRASASPFGLSGVADHVACLRAASWFVHRAAVIALLPTDEARQVHAPMPPGPRAFGRYCYAANPRCNSHRSQNASIQCGMP